MHRPCIMNGAAEAGWVHTEGTAAGSFCRSGALNSCGMPLERATVITARSCSGKPCAVHAEATDDMRRMLAAEKASAVPSAAGCSATCRGIRCTQWQRLRRIHTPVTVHIASLQHVDAGVVIMSTDLRCLSELRPLFRMMRPDWQCSQLNLRPNSRHTGKQATFCLAILIHPSTGSTASSPAL